MSKITDEELSELGITRTYVKSGYSKRKAYIYKCASCGRPTQLFVLRLDKPVYCNICRTNAKKRLEAAQKEAERRELELNSLNTDDANRKARFQKAAAIMQKLGGYDKAIKKAETAYNKFDSVPEAIAAIILLNAGYRVIAQQQLAKYKVDFLLPDYKLAIEVDGSLYHNDNEKLAIRDMFIKYMLGDEWEIIHVPAESLMKRPKAFERLIKNRIQSINLV